MVHVTRAGQADWETVRATRLRALADSPSAFGSTLARESAFDEPEWRERVEHGTWFLARADGQPLGIAAGVPEGRAPDERHLVAMWVEPQRRGTTVAADLVGAVCRWARADGAVGVTLWVADGNPRARRFYERLGFRATGERQPLPRAPEMSRELMRRPLMAGSGE
jgi:GNAT superfamily N-acetyltransferase